MRQLVVAAAALLACLSSGKAHSEDLLAGYDKAARAWFAAQHIDIQAMSKLPTDERARRLTAAVYNFCETPKDQPITELNRLFQTCVARCGGYSYVLRGLLQATGAETRFVNLNNIPNQGNHTAVEVLTEDGEWRFYDPTFGAFFTDNGKFTGKTLGMREISVDLRKADLAKMVKQASDDISVADALTKPLEKLYGDKYEHPNMVLRNYQIAEAISYDTPGEMVALEIPLSLEKDALSVGNMKAVEFEDMKAGWLKYTRSTFLDGLIETNTSYNAALLYNSSRDTLTVIALHDMDPDRPYTMKMMFYAPQEGMQVQITRLGSNAFYDGDAQIYVRRVGKGSTVYMYGIDIAAKKGSAAPAKDVDKDAS